MHKTNLTILSIGLLLFLGCNAPVITAVGEPYFELISGQLGGSGHRDGIGAEARLFNPMALVRDEQGRIYVGDSDGGDLRRYDTKTGQVTTLSYRQGSERTRHSGGDNEYAVSYCPPLRPRKGRLYGAYLEQIYNIDPESGAKESLFSFESGSVISQLLFDNQDHLYVFVQKHIWENVRVEKIDLKTKSHQIVVGVESSTDDLVNGVGSEARLDRTIHSIAFDGDHTAYMTDTLNLVRSVDLNTYQVKTVHYFDTSDEDVSDEGVLNGIWVEGESVYVADADGIVKLDSTGKQVSTIFRFDESKNDIDQRTAEHVISGLVGDGQGNLYFAELTNRTISKLDLKSKEVTVVVGVSNEYAFLNGPLLDARYFQLSGVASLGDKIYVTQSISPIVRQLDLATGQVSTLAGDPTNGEDVWQDGAGTDVLFAWPGAMIADASGILYVNDGASIRAATVRTRGVSTLAGVADDYDHIDGKGLEARFGDIGGITWDGKNTIYIAETGWHAIRRFEIDTGNVETVVGGEPSGDEDGVGSAARISNPTGIVLDGDVLYIADSIALRQVDTKTWRTTKLLARPPGKDEVPFHVVFPWVMAKSPTGSIYLADSKRGILERYDTKTNQLIHVAGQLGVKAVSVGKLPATLNTPWAMTFRLNGDLVIVDNAEGAIVALRGPLP